MKNMFYLLDVCIIRVATVLHSQKIKSTNKAHCPMRICKDEKNPILVYNRQTTPLLPFSSETLKPAPWFHISSISFPTGVGGPQTIPGQLNGKENLHRKIYHQRNSSEIQ
jgi:hypothetical protein